MSTQLMGDALLRSRSAPLLSFLAPAILNSSSVALRPQFASSRLLLNNSSTSQRCLATRTDGFQAAKNKADNPAVVQALKSKKSEALRTEGNALSPAEVKEAALEGTKKTADGGGIAAALGQMLGYKNEGLGSESYNFPSNRADNRRRPARLTITGQRGPTLAERQGAIAKGMVFDNDDSGYSTQEAVRRGMGSALKISDPPPPPIRLDAFVGRSEVVDPTRGADLGTAMRNLQKKMVYNNIRGDFHSQRFHERPGLKRKRLKSERWRMRFKEGFKAVCSKVLEMRRKGW